MWKILTANLKHFGPLCHFDVLPLWSPNLLFIKRAVPCILRCLLNNLYTIWCVLHISGDFNECVKGSVCAPNRENQQELWKETSWGERINARAFDVEESKFRDSKSKGNLEEQWFEHQLFPNVSFSTTQPLLLKWTSNSFRSHHRD